MIIENIKKNAKKNINAYVVNIINLIYRHEKFDNKQDQYDTDCGRCLIVNFDFHFIFFIKKPAQLNHIVLITFKTGTPIFAAPIFYLRE